MLKKTILCSSLVLNVFCPMVTHADTRMTASVKVPIPDGVVTAQVKAKLLIESALKDTAISVTTRDGVVFLKGTVDTNTQYEKVVSIANSAEGASDVNADDLFVTSSDMPIQDLYITAKVKGSLLKEKLFGDQAIESWPIHVETKNASVYLSGTVASEVERDKIINFVRGINGVQGVESTINVGK